MRDAHVWPRAWRRAVSAGSASRADSVAESFARASPPSPDVWRRTTSARQAARGPSTPWYRIKLMRGRGTSTASRPRNTTGSEHDVRRPIAPRLPELQPHLSLVGQVDPIPGHGRTQRVATYAIEPLPLPSRYDKARVQSACGPGDERRRGASASGGGGPRALSSKPFPRAVRRAHRIMGARYLASSISPLAEAPGASAMHAVRNAIAATSSRARRKATDCVYDRLAAPASLSQ